MQPLQHTFSLYTALRYLTSSIYLKKHPFCENFQSDSKALCWSYLVEDLHEYIISLDKKCTDFIFAKAYSKSN